MINITTLKCIFANLAATYAKKLSVGAECGLDKCGLYEAYNLLQIAKAQADNGCDITPNTLSKILELQNTQALVIQTCC